MHRRVAAEWSLILLSLQLCWPCCAAEENRFKEAQSLMDRLVAERPQIVRLTLHAVPYGEKNSRIIACNIKEKIGKPSDPEDLEAMRDNKVVILREGDHLDVTAPIVDKDGKPIAATGITLRFREGDTDEGLAEKARSIAKELSTAIQKAKGPLW